MRVYLESLGCKLNQSEIEGMARRLHHAGHEVVYQPEEAGVCLVNSCAVTHTAARKTRQAVRRLARQNPAARIVVLGCYAGLWPDELAGLGQIDVLADAHAKEEIVAALGLSTGGAEPTAWSRRRTRSFVKVQDGCNNHCTYCIVRVARGPERSRPLDEILAEVRDLADQGVQEIVLTGVHVGAYGRELGLDLSDLVQAILAQADFPRLRLSSIEPWHLEPRFFGLWQNERLCRQLHLPLQSGCSATLRRMARRYTSDQFAALLEEARAHIPGLAVTTDVMVGFPGEDESEFEESLRFVERMAFSRLHVFRYSRRPGTPAAGYPDQVPAEVSAARSDRMQAVGIRTGEAFHNAFLGQTLPVLWECLADNGRDWEGLTDNYLRVWAESAENLHNRITPAHLLTLEADGVRGRLAPSIAPGI